MTAARPQQLTDTDLIVIVAFSVIAVLGVVLALTADTWSAYFRGHNNGAATNNCGSAATAKRLRSDGTPCRFQFSSEPRVGGPRRRDITRRIALAAATAIPTAGN